MITHVNDAYRQLAHLISDAAFINVDDRIVFANPAFVSLLGATDDAQILGRSPFDFIHPASRALARDRIAYVLATGNAVHRIDQRWVRLDGSVCVARTAAAPISWDGAPALQVVLNDVTSARSLTLGMQEVEDLLADVLADIDEVVYAADGRTGTLAYVSPSVERLYGRAAAEFYADPALWHLVVHPDDVAIANAVLASINAGENYNVEYRIVRRDGEIRWIRDRGRCVAHEGSDGGPRVVGVVTDVATEHARRASDVLVSSVVDTAVDGIIVITADGAIELFNPAASSLFGYTRDEVMGKNISVLMPQPHRGQHAEYVQRYLDTGTRRIIGIGREVEGQRKDGTLFPFRLSVSEMIIDGVCKFAGTIHDLTAQKRAERALQEQESLARLGQMAAVVAHEVKNPLAGLSGVLEILRDRRAADDGERPLFDEMLKRIRSLNRMVDDLLIFARPMQLKPTHTTMDRLVAAALAPLREDPRVAQHTLTVSYDGDPLCINADEDLLKGVFQNLVINAAQAMATPGPIAITLSRLDGSCRVAVTNAGPSIPPELRDRIFEPFFTTKTGGTGLGLPISQRTVRLHGGDLQLVETTSGRTTFLVSLPLVSAR